MLSVGIVDDGVGFVPTLAKLRQVVSANFVCLVEEKELPLGCKNSKQLMDIGATAVGKLSDMGCQAIVLSSVALTSRCLKSFADSALDVFGCDAPVLHATTYTASKVLVAGDPFAVRAQTLPDIIKVEMPDFPQLAQSQNERIIVRYISDMCEKYAGQFDCIALANSSMNFYKHSFSRVFPNVKIFDSLEGVARRIRKKYKKTPKEEGVCTVIDADGNSLEEKYRFFLE